MPASFLVRATRLELARFTPLEPKSSASANSATPAGIILIILIRALNVNNMVFRGVSYRAFYDIKVFLPWDIAVRSTVGWLTDLLHEKNFINSSNRTLPFFVWYKAAIKRFRHP